MDFPQVLTLRHGCVSFVPEAVRKGYSFLSGLLHGLTPWQSVLLRVSFSSQHNIMTQGLRVSVHFTGEQAVVRCGYATCPRSQS